MSILLKLSARHLRLNRKRTLITIIAIALSIAMITAISGFIVSFQDMLYRDAIARDGLWHVRYFQLDEETAARVAAEPLFAEHSITEEEGGLSVKLLFRTLDRHLFDRSEEVCKRLGIGKDQVQYHNNLLIAKGMIPAGYYESLFSFAAVLLTLVGIASVMVIGNAFSISAAERSRQFGVLKSVGATSRQVRSTVLWEGILLGAGAIPLGIVAGMLAEWVALSVANHIIGMIEAVHFMAQFRVVFSFWVILLAVAGAFVTILLAAWLPARTASRLSAVDAIRQTAAIRVRPRDVRISPLTGRLFGFKGILAAKTMRRGRGRYRTTILSLVVSIVLFIGVTSFGQMLFKASSMVYEDYGSNAMVRIFGGDKELQERLAAEVAVLDDVQTYPYRELQGTAEIPTAWMTATGLEMLGAGEKNVFLYSLSDEAFAALCKSQRLDAASLADAGAPGGILINTSGTYIRQGRRHNFAPYRLPAGETIPVQIDGETHPLTIAGKIDTIPTAFNLFFAANSMTLVVPESVRAAWQPGGRKDEIFITAMAIHPEAFCDAARSLLADKLGDNELHITNYEALAENNRNIYTLIMIFIYGFIAMLTLISVTNVITTISTGISLRRREFAMLRSVGMTQKNIAGSLRYESLIYGTKALLYGIPLGLGASFAMYYALEGSMSFAFIWPVDGIVISIAAVMLLTFATTAFASSRQRRDNIVGVLQNEIT